MGLSIKTSGDLIGVSRLQQSDRSTPATLDALILFNEDSSIDIEEERIDDQDEKTGHVEATDVEVQDSSATGTLTMDKATPDGIAWMSAMFCHNSVEADLGSTAFSHTARMNAYPDEPDAYFTAAHRRGGSGGRPADLRRNTGLAINTFTVSASKGEFLTIAAGLLGLGQVADGLKTEIIAVDFDATIEAVLDSKIEADEYQSVTVWADLDDDLHYETELPALTYTEGTDTLTFTDPSVTGVHNVRISYSVKDTDTAHFGSPSWRTNLEELESQDEFRLKAANIQIVVGGLMTDAPPPAKSGGQVALCEVESLEYQGDWQGQPGKCWRQGATATSIATQVELADMRQTITVNRQVRDYMFKQNFDANTPIGIYLDAVGPEIGGGIDFGVKIFWPRVKFLEKPFQVSDGKWVEAGSLLVLKDVANDLPTSIFEVTNAVANYVA